MTDSQDPFVGRWELDPSQSKYGHGTPPKSGIYEIHPHKDGYRFVIHWKTADGSDGHTSFEGIPDDQRYPHPDAEVCDAMVTTRMHVHRLDTKAIKDDEVVNHATRELSEDKKVMTVQQRGKTPQGKDYCNVAVYRRSS